ncbi:MAG: hypothetical protein JRN32_00060 [Nitrososphaerota archaeon]|jgi:Zn-dependent protease|nr:hypothetical protein [Nitrososphaerota archaeon]MDG7040234.1 hypothetical protein [Nitrososphaerota archaeon]MDG7041700.1 hypothetical protein [Nitrososphaerota archaeon]MDG7045196.1 hypothetical protein [Nitrososphaerota archaeon]MDG7047147.1 hypothetical protein [Nitrososphaerota archaeon]
MPKQESLQDSTIRSSGTYYFEVRGPRYRRSEAVHLIIGSLLVWGVGASWLLGIVNSWGFIIDSLLFLAAFILHEYMHKVAAIRSGFMAQFRLQSFGAILTFISIIIPFFKIIAPGATMIYGSGDESSLGKIALWGPLTNIIMAIALLPFVLYSPYGGVLVLALYFNAFIATFNLLPVAILDGLKVFRWNKAAWAISIAASAGLLIYTYLLIDGIIGIP